MNYKNITIGADPELFVIKDGEVISAEGLIGGTKNEPRIITKEGHAIQEDNVMVEFNIPASKSKEEFVNNINTVLSFLDTELFLKDCKLHYSSSEELNSKYLQTEQAKMFGCQPDFNVYAKKPNKSPSSKTNLRTCGGHIHIGYENSNLKDTENIIKAMDLFLGIPSVLLDPDVRRKTMYGKAGAFRFKSYGCEYRSLSNFWLKTDELKEWVYDSTIEAIKFISKKENIELLNSYSKEIEQCINNNDKQMAETLLKLTKKQIKELV